MGCLSFGHILLTTSVVQWDSPAAWAPLQLLVADGLLHIRNTTAKDVRHGIMCRFLNSMALGYNNTGKQLLLCCRFWCSRACRLHV